MRIQSILPLSLAALCAWGVLLAQRPFGQFRDNYDDGPLPANWQQKTEWYYARLRYPGMGRGRGGDMSWSTDYPRSDRHLLQGVRRLTRIDSRAVEQVVQLDPTGDVDNWPMLYAVEVGHWYLPNDQAAQLREYLLRGGFLMVDDFHGVDEWEVFMASMSRVFPDRPVVDIPDNDPIFHVLYDLDRRVQVPGVQWLSSGRTYENGETGRPERWRAIYDDKGRIMVAICFNMDLGDAWEWSDDPRYPEKWATLAYQIGMNYFVYGLTH
jgi:hypothetical protein